MSDMSPELKALVAKVREAQHDAEVACLRRAAETRVFSIDEVRLAMALAAIRCVATATREASEGMHEAFYNAKDLNLSAGAAWRNMHAASVLGEALRHE